MSHTRVVGVIASAHRNGNTATLVREALAAAKERGAETEEIFLPERDLAYCSGCMSCSRTGRCALEDDFEEIRAALCKADGIILSSPVYGGAPSARMKNLLDRLGLFEFMTSSVFGGTYVGVIATASGFGAPRTAATLAASALNTLFGRAYLSGTVAVNLRGTAAGSDPAHLRRAAALGRRLVDDHRRQRTYPLQNLKGRITRMIIERSMRRAIVANRDAMGGVYSTLAARGLIA